ncbi:hypothetical protein CVT26_006704 [Gymnopilus dilepis]|uniref:Uncharacterized protein n=1 Tax=Gymnopilus dilepis TaxID=231916 RepID=A0A409Y2R6_9AGAR|nr:hypothetical protein CVT26_006704 [Gymnopilus dilepis]
MPAYRINAEQRERSPAQTETGRRGDPSVCSARSRSLRQTERVSLGASASGRLWEIMLDSYVAVWGGGGGEGEGEGEGSAHACSDM